MDELWVVDATALLFRAYYAMPPRLSPAGEHVGAVLGLGHLLRALLRRRPAHLALTFDAGATTFRTRIDPRYKANRGEPPPDLAPQFDRARAFSEQAGFCTLSVPDFEADDLMATLARRGRAAGLRVRLFSVDKDLCQLVGDGVVLEDPRTGEECDEGGVVRRLGVSPSQVVDFMALTGDSVDNIPGVPGVGPKAALSLVRAFGDLDRVYACLDQVASLPIRGARSLQARLLAGREEAYLARTLVRLHDDAPIDVCDLREASRWRGPPDGADAFFAALGSPGALRGLRALASA
jgi:DNA polymerase-1